MSKKAWSETKEAARDDGKKNQDFKGIISIPCMDVRTTSESCCFHFFSRSRSSHGYCMYTLTAHHSILIATLVCPSAVAVHGHTTPPLPPQIPFFQPTSDHNWVEWWLNYHIWKLVVAEQHVKKAVADDNEADEADEYKSCTYLTDKFYLFLESLNSIVTEWHYSKIIALGHPFMPTERGPRSQAMLPPHCC